MLRSSASIATVVRGVLRALPICAPVAFLGTQTTLAQTGEPTRLAADIPAQPLARALSAFASETGLQLAYVSGIVRDQRSHAVSAGLSADAALASLLHGTGLRFEYLTPHSVRIFAPVAPAGTNMPARTEEEMREVIVTANRREENLQNVPITIQVLTGDKLAKLNATSFDDFESYLPGVTAHGVGPAQNNIYMRGLATSEGGIQSAGISGSFPNVAVYLDEQSAQLPYRNLDIYVADLERIEILEGPQGTLFGAGAQAGVVRYITNKPKLNVTEALFNAGYATTAHGDQSSSGDATINIPVIRDKLALRGVIYSERRGGYIDNIPATFARADSDGGIRYANYPTGCGSNSTPAGPPCQVPPHAPVLNNANVVARAMNPVTYQGMRLQGLYQFNDDWSALLAQSYQTIEAQGVFAEMATNSLGEPQPDLAVQLYNPSFNKDRFENTALTVDGRAGALKILYAGSYLVRNVEQVHDYTSYARGPYADYYQCVNPGATPATAQCFTPSSTWHDQERNTHLSQELRLSTPSDWRLRGVGGLFYEDYRIQEQSDWFYLTALPYFNPIGPPTGYYTLNGSPTLPNGQPVPFYQQGAVFVPAPVTSINPNIRPPGDGFFSDVTRDYKQKAAYLSADFDLIPKTLTLAAGTRYYSSETTAVGSTVGGFGCLLVSYPMAPNPCVNHSNIHNLDSRNLDQTYSGFKSRANLSWKIAQDAMLYYNWSQGFRAGGFNRSFSVAANSPLADGSQPWQAQAHEHGGLLPPITFAPDNLTNNELGWKTMWLDYRIQWDGALYLENWDGAQIGAVGTGARGSGSTLTINGGNYRVRGVETFLVAHLSPGLTIEGGANWNHSELIKEATFVWADGTPVDFSLLQTSTGKPFPNPGGTLGSGLAGAPPFQGNVRVRYELSLSGYDGFAQLSAVHQAHSLASSNRFTPDLQGNSTAYDLPAFTSYDGAVGLGKDSWLVELYGENLTDTRAQLYANYAQQYKAVTVSRPRTIGVRYSYKFSHW